MNSKTITVHQPTNLFGDFHIGEGTSIGAFCDIGGKVGKYCKIQTGVSIPPLAVVRDYVFMGPGSRIANDRKMNSRLKGTIIDTGAKIGMGALIGAGIKIGKDSIIGMGSVVLHDVPPGATVVGNPAKRIK